jgi:hypothetical protein
MITTHLCHQDAGQHDRHLAEAREQFLGVAENVHPREDAPQ